MQVRVHAQLIGGPREPLLVDQDISVGALLEEVAHTVGRPPGSFKLVLKGQPLPLTESHRLKLAEGDVMVVVPARKPTSARLVNAALDVQRGAGRRGGEDEDNDDDEEEPSAQLPQGAPVWEVAVVATARRWGCTGTALEWLVLIRPLRLLMFVLFIGGCLVSSRLSLGPPFILCSMIVAIFCNLGRKKAGEASAYSVFNPGVQRLPGQLDADAIDQQMRRGQMM